MSIEGSAPLYRATNDEHLSFHEGEKQPIPIEEAQKIIQQDIAYLANLEVQFDENRSFSIIELADMENDLIEIFQRINNPTFAGGYVEESIEQAPKLLEKVLERQRENFDISATLEEIPPFDEVAGSDAALYYAEIGEFQKVEAKQSDLNAHFKEKSKNIKNQIIDKEQEYKAVFTKKPQPFRSRRIEGFKLRKEIQELKMDLFRMMNEDRDLSDEQNKLAKEIIYLEFKLYEIFSLKETQEQLNASHSSKDDMNKQLDIIEGKIRSAQEALKDENLKESDKESYELAETSLNSLKNDILNKINQCESEINILENEKINLLKEKNNLEEEVKSLEKHLTRLNELKMEFRNTLPPSIALELALDDSRNLWRRINSAQEELHKSYLSDAEKAELERDIAMLSNLAELLRKEVLSHTAEEYSLTGDRENISRSASVIPDGVKIACGAILSQGVSDKLLDPSNKLDMRTTIDRVSIPDQTLVDSNRSGFAISVVGKDKKAAKPIKINDSAEIAAKNWIDMLRNAGISDDALPHLLNFTSQSSAFHGTLLINIESERFFPGREVAPSQKDNEPESIYYNLIVEGNQVIAIEAFTRFKFFDTSEMELLPDTVSTVSRFDFERDETGKCNYTKGVETIYAWKDEQ